MEQRIPGCEYHTYRRILYRSCVYYSCLIEDEHSGSKHGHVEGIVKIRIIFSFKKRGILLVYVIRLYYNARCKTKVL